MMKKLLYSGKFALSAVFVTGISINVHAQKLSAVQANSILAPQKVKIDGKLDEWNNNFQAYNKSTKLLYTMANDDKNLYLVVKCEDQQNNSKIIGGGITLTINTADKKKEENAYSVKFPILNRASMRGLRRPRGSNQNTVMDSASIAEAAAARKQVIASLKEISVLGFKSITDSLISIYNEYGIKAAVAYDDKANLQYELSIPLSLLEISADKPKEFAYNLKVNGVIINNNNNGRRDGNGSGFGGRNGGGGFGNNGGNRNGGGNGGGNDNRVNFDEDNMMSPTDFWGKYTLAKK